MYLGDDEDELVPENISDQLDDLISSATGFGQINTNLNTLFGR
jgi:hypothetical protein